MGKQCLMLHSILKHRKVNPPPPPRIGNLCDTCGYTGKQNSSIRMHEGVHEGLLMTTVINCSGCGDKVMTRKYLESHKIANHTRRGGDCVKCDGCEYKRMGTQCLRFHRRLKHVYYIWWLETFVIPVDIQRS